MGLTTCKCCGGKFDTKLKVVVNQKNYCPACAPQFAKGSKNFVNITDLFTEKWENDREINYQILVAHLNNMCKKYDVDYSEVYYVMDYMYHYKDPPAEPMRNESNIYSVMFYYNEGKQFWREYKYAHSITTEQIEKILSAPVEVVKLKRSEIDKQHEKALSRKDNLNIVKDKKSDLMSLMEEYEDVNLDGYVYDFSDEFKNFNHEEFLRKQREKEQEKKDILKQILMENGLCQDNLDDNDFWEGVDS